MSRTILFYIMKKVITPVNHKILAGTLVSLVLLLVLIALHGVAIPCMTRQVVLLGPGAQKDAASVSFFKNYEKHWLTFDHLKEGAQFDGVISNNGSYLSIGNWIIRVKVPENTIVDDNHHGANYEVLGGILKIRSKDREEIISSLESISDYIIAPGESHTFGCILYTPIKSMMIGTEISLEYTPLIYLSRYHSYWILLVVLFAVFISDITYLQVNWRRYKFLHEELKRNEEFISGTLMLFARTIEAKDSSTHGHSERVAFYSREIAWRMHLSDEQIKIVYYAAIIHDVGKIGMPDYILNKPGSLNEEEQAIMRRHSEIGGEIFKDFRYVPGIAEIVRTHHERFDGTGYPRGLKGEEIPLLSRIIAVADSFDVMTSDRAYRNRLSLESVIDQLREGRGKQFDPVPCDIMLDLIAENIAPITVVRE